MTAETSVGPFVSQRRVLSRRRFLRGAGAALALPFLDAMRPAFARTPADATPGGKPRRMLAVCNNLGLLPDQFFPKDSGRNYTPSPYLELLQKHRNDLTTFGGVSHPDVDGGHPADICFLTAAPHPGRGGFRNTISLDQFMAERIGHLTRVPSLNLGVNTDRGNGSVSWTSTGVMIPAEQKGSEVFKRLFVQGTPEEAAAQIRKLELGQSILDSVADQANDLRRTLGPRDRGRLDQYLTSVRELEQRMAMAREWEKKPKPAIIAKAPTDPGSPRLYMEKVRMMYDLARLAFETDATRLVTILLDSVNSPAMHIEGVEITDGYHNLSHHGRSQAKLAQLKAIDGWHMKLLDELFTNLKAVSEDGDTLLDRSMILYGTNLGNAQTHVTANLPTVFAGGGFRHGQHLAFDTYRNYPLANLFVSMLQRMGIEIDRFSTGIATMRGLEMV
jgi:Protein of unknown function (DUF1552)